MLRVVKRIRAAFEPREELHGEIQHIRSLIHSAKEQTAYNEQVIEYIRKRVEEDERKLRERP